MNLSYLHFSSDVASTTMAAYDQSEFRALADIIAKERITTLFQPIFNLRTGDIWGCEALSRVIGKSPFEGPEALFAAAGQYQMTARLEKLCRQQALQNAYRRCIEPPITLNVCPSVLQCPEHEKGLTLSLIEELADFKNKVILELTERYYIRDNKQFSATVDYYRRQGFRIAIDDLGSGFAGLNMLIQIEPYIVKIDRLLIADIHQSPKKRMLIESLVSFCRRINALVVAEGIERLEELEALINMDIDLGQGFLLARPAVYPGDCSSDARACIVDSKRKRLGGNRCGYSDNIIDALVRYVEPVELNQAVLEVAERFKKDATLCCLPVVKGAVPVGIIHKNKLFFKLGQRFGNDLFSHKAVKAVMESALLFDSGAPLEKVSRSVLTRDQNSVYDAVVVVQNGAYKGIVKINQLLERITQQKIDMAQQANPLSGLPGNNLIKEEIVGRLATGQLFAVMYFDLDNFKPFNDNFGFEQGDRVIRFLGNFLKNLITNWDLNGFVGHVGGDDFVAVCRFQELRTLCREIVDRFDREIQTFHDEETVQNGFYICQDRKGRTCRLPLLALSIAVVSNAKRHFKTYGQLVSVASEMKKKSKMMSGSSFCFDRRSG